jgi:allantoate deiminase
LSDWGRRAETILAQLARISRPGAGVTRLPFTPEHRAAIALLRRFMEETAGLAVTLDAAGTLIGRLEGYGQGAPTFLLGSHQDSVPEGGAYDGIMGVVLPILALARLRESGVSLPFAVEVLAFSDEEGVRFPTTLIGSRALAGRFSPDVLEMRDREGITLREAMIDFGLEPDEIPRLARSPGQILGFLEVHIEQGPMLERAGIPLGVVTAISGIERLRVTVEGETGHAGTLPMEGRRDALVGAARLIMGLNEIGRTTRDLRATVGALHVAPGAVNAVPRLAELTAELRAPDDRVRQAASARFVDLARQTAQAANLGIGVERTYEQPARACDRRLVDLLERAVRSMGREPFQVPSGATHDASAMADLCPIAMLFVRCRAGISHAPSEYASTADMSLAVKAIAHFLEGLNNHPFLSKFRRPDLNL